MRAYLPAFGAALMYGLSPIIVKLGLVGGFSPLAGILISIMPSIPLSYLVVRAMHIDFRLAFKDRTALAYVLLAGTVHMIGTLFQYMALRLENASVVQPITATNPLIALFLIFIFLREEKVTIHVVAGATMVVIGSILVVTR